MKVLRKGSKGEDVKRLQTFLASHHIDSGEPDGIFGLKTMAAVIEYQAHHGLMSDGEVGPKTYAVLLNEGMDFVFDDDKEWPERPEWLSPLTSNEERMKHWGRFEYRPSPESGNREAITILGSWEDENIVRFMCPVFNRNVRLNKVAVQPYLLFMEKLKALGLNRHLLTHEGGFNARFIRGSRKTLSNHAWGTAFDVNFEWNQLGHTPAFKGETGSVRELVETANSFNFFWGGHFTGRRDGMHFELCP